MVTSSQGFSRPCDRAVVAIGWQKQETEVICWGLLSSTDACPKCLSTSLFFSIVSGHLLPSVHAETVPCQLGRDREHLHLSSLLVLLWEALSMPASWLESHAIPPNIFYFALLFFPHSFARHWAVDKESVLKNLTRKGGNSVQDKKGETTTFLCFVSTAVFSPQPGIFGCNFQTLLQEIQKMAQCIPCYCLQHGLGEHHRLADMGCWCKEFRNRMLLAYRSQQCVDGQGLVTNLQADLPWFDCWSFGQFKGRKQHKRAKQCVGSLQGEEQKKPQTLE